MIGSMAFVGCAGPRGDPGEDGYMDIRNLTLTVYEKEWQLSGNVNYFGSYYYCEFRVGDITNYVYENGMITGNIFITERIGNSNVEVQKPLPYTVYNGTSDGTNEVLWSERYSYEIRPGYITFMVYYSYFYTDTLPPTSDFTLTIAWYSLSSINYK